MHRIQCIEYNNNKILHQHILQSFFRWQYVASLIILKKVISRQALTTSAAWLNVTSQGSSTGMNTRDDWESTDVSFVMFISEKYFYLKMLMMKFAYVGLAHL